MLYVEEKGKIWCPTCYDEMMEAKEDEESTDG